MNDLGLILLRMLIGYLLLIILMKFMGKREVGQLSLFDLLILLTIVDIMVVGIENFKENYLYSVLPMIGVAVIQKIIAILSLKWVWFRNLIDGKEVVIVEKGKVRIDIMKQNGYNMDDLYAQLREKGYTSPNEIEYAILENSGKLSIFTKDDNLGYPLPLITSGKINKENVKKAGYTIEEINVFIKKEGYTSFKQIYGLNIINNKLEIVSIAKLNKN